MPHHFPALRHILFVLGYALSVTAAQAQPTPAPQAGCSADGCFSSFNLPGHAGRFHYYASARPGLDFHPQSALIVMHGHPRDADRSFAAGMTVIRDAHATDQVLVIAPLFQVAPDQATHCHSKHVPVAQSDDALWTCGGWLNGSLSASSPHIGAFAALDALIAQLAQDWPSLKTITLSGFSAGGQLLQRYVGFAAPAPQGIHLRYVIADPGSWLYFDPVRPHLSTTSGQMIAAENCGGADFPAQCQLDFGTPPASEDCPEYDDWKYGLKALPDHLQSIASAARQHYATADIHYLEAEQDSSTQRGAFYKILDKSCGAMLQGPFRLQRGVAYAAYDHQYLATDGSHPLTLIPGCAHRVTCVFAQTQAQRILLGH